MLSRDSLLASVTFSTSLTVSLRSAGPTTAVVPLTAYHTYHQRDGEGGV